MTPSHLRSRLGLGLLLLAVGMFGGCRSVVPVPERSARTAHEPGTIDQRLFVVVHGDADYLYHDGKGRPHRADRETLREAFAAARTLKQAEVFIVHQRSDDPFLGVVPRSDGTLYHFRHGRLLRQETYDQKRGAALTVEGDWIARRKTAQPDSSLFTAALYYGHAVPERSRTGYHRSRPDAAFGMKELARGFGHLISSEPIDVVVLSTCDGGTPRSLATLADRARYVVAAPGDLHLSFIDADLLATLDTVNTATTWAHTLTDRAFQRLTARTVTSVQLATYDMNLAGPVAKRMADRVIPDTSIAPTGGRHVDCRRVLGKAVDTTGVYVRYRPPKFGRRADKKTHSGWACLPPPTTSP